MITHDIFTQAPFTETTPSVLFIIVHYLIVKHVPKCYEHEYTEN